MEPAHRRLLTARQAADYLGISLATLNRVEKGGALTPWRTPGGHRRYNREMLDDYLKKVQEVWRGRGSGPRRAK
jgi:excisionase family DNA binding protein